MANNVRVTGVSSTPDFTTEVVVVGTGPAGGSIASFLGSHGRFVSVVEQKIRLTMSRCKGNRCRNDLNHSRHSTRTHL